MARKTVLLIFACALVAGYVSCTRPRPPEVAKTGPGGKGPTPFVNAPERLPLRLRWAIEGDRLKIGDFSYSRAWEIQHEGRRAFLLHTNQADGYNTVFNAFGFAVCHPSGGFDGSGDGRCPEPKDPGTESVLVWSGR